jgi:hypothetical protein
MEQVVDSPIDIRLSAHIDLFYHCFSQIEVYGDASSLYSEVYCREIQRARRRYGLAGRDPAQWRELATLYDQAPAAYWLTFLPFAATSRASLIGLLRALAAADATGARQYLAPAHSHLVAQVTHLSAAVFLSRFIPALEGERDLHDRMWADTLAYHREVVLSFVRFLADRCAACLEQLGQELAPRRIRAYLAPGLRAGGRAVASLTGDVTAAVMMPRRPQEPYDSLFQLVHELTHHVTDEAIVGAEGPLRHDTRMSSPHYGVHRRLEHAVHRYDYQLFATQSEELRLRYVRWAAQVGLVG